jgi:hypothetical protein
MARRVSGLREKISRPEKHWFLKRPNQIASKFYNKKSEK